MSNAEEFELKGTNSASRRAPNLSETLSRAVGSPLPVGEEGTTQQRPQSGSTVPGRALTSSPTVHEGQPSNLQRAVGAFRMALPYVQRVLPLLDGNIATAVASLLTPHAQTPAPPKPANLVLLEDGLAQLHTQQRDLRSQIVEQNASLKRVEDHLEMVREATDRNTLEQQELIKDLKSVSNRITMFAVIILGLLGVSIAVNVVLYLHLRGILP